MQRPSNFSTLELEHTQKTEKDLSTINKLILLNLLQDMAEKSISNKAWLRNLASYLETQIPTIPNSLNFTRICENFFYAENQIYKLKGWTAWPRFAIKTVLTYASINESREPHIFEQHMLICLREIDNISDQQQRDMSEQDLDKHLNSVICDAATPLSVAYNDFHEAYLYSKAAQLRQKNLIQEKLRAIGIEEQQPNYSALLQKFLLNRYAQFFLLTLVNNTMLADCTTEEKIALLEREHLPSLSHALTICPLSNLQSYFHSVNFSLAEHEAVEEFVAQIKDPQRKEVIYLNAIVSPLFVDPRKYSLIRDYFHIMSNAEQEKFARLLAVHVKSWTTAGAIIAELPEFLRLPIARVMACNIDQAYGVASIMHTLAFNADTQLEFFNIVVKPKLRDVTELSVVLHAMLNSAQIKLFREYKDSVRSMDDLNVLVTSVIRGDEDLDYLLEFKPLFQAALNGLNIHQDVLSPATILKEEEYIRLEEFLGHFHPRLRFGFVVALNIRFESFNRLKRMLTNRMLSANITFNFCWAAEYVNYHIKNGNDLVGALPLQSENQLIDFFKSNANHVPNSEAMLRILSAIKSWQQQFTLLVLSVGTLNVADFIRALELIEDPARRLIALQQKFSIADDEDKAELFQSLRTKGQILLFERFFTQYSQQITNPEVASLAAYFSNGPAQHKPLGFLILIQIIGSNTRDNPVNLSPYLKNVEKLSLHDTVELVHNFPPVYMQQILSQSSLLTFAISNIVAALKLLRASHIKTFLELELVRSKVTTFAELKVILEALPGYFRYDFSYLVIEQIRNNQSNHTASTAVLGVFSPVASDTKRDENIQSIADLMPSNRHDFIKLATTKVTDFASLMNLVVDLSPEARERILYVHAHLINQFEKLSKAVVFLPESLQVKFITHFATLVTTFDEFLHLVKHLPYAAQRDELVIANISAINGLVQFSSIASHLSPELAKEILTHKNVELVNFSDFMIYFNMRLKYISTGVYLQVDELVYYQKLIGTFSDMELAQLVALLHPEQRAFYISANRHNATTATLQHKFYALLTSALFQNGNMSNALALITCHSGSDSPTLVKSMERICQVVDELPLQQSGYKDVLKNYLGAALTLFEKQVLTEADLKALKLLVYKRACRINLENLLEGEPKFPANALANLKQAGITFNDLLMAECPYTTHNLLANAEGVLTYIASLAENEKAPAIQDLLKTVNENDDVLRSKIKITKRDVLMEDRDTGINPKRPKLNP